MTFTYKPAALHCRWNKDLSITISSRGRKLTKIRFCGFADPRKSAEAYIEGWFGPHPRQVRWTWA